MFNLNCYVKMTTIYHTLQAYLYQNHLTDDDDSYYARIAANRSLSFDEICESAVSRGGSSLSVEHIKSGTTAFLEEAKFLLCDGYSLNTDWLNAYIKVVGSFDKPHDTFDTDRHEIKFVLRPGTSLRDELSATTVEIQGLADTEPYIDQVVDVYTGSVNSTLTPNRILRIVGDKLKVDGSDSTIGVYFVSTTDGTTTRVEDADVVRNNPSELEVMIPELSADSYNVRIISQYSRSQLLNSPRTIDFGKSLTVV